MNSTFTRILISTFLVPSLACAQTASQVNQFDPADQTTLVFNTREFNSDLSSFKNYKGWKTNSSVLHNRDLRTLRKPGDIKFLVLHESAGPDNGFGFRPPNTAHFSVLRNGDILQFNDMAQVQYHAFQFNNAGIGVEFVNQSWMVNKGIPAYEVSMTAAQKSTYAESKGYVWTFWGDGYNVYYLPDADQLEALNGLVKRLVRKLDPGFPSINNTWLQYVSYDDVKSVWEFADAAKIPASDAGKAVKRYFIFTNAYNYMDPSRFKDFESGIVSHSVINSVKSNGFIDENAHPDGSFQALYCWLRQRFEPAESFEKAKELMKNKMVVMRTKTNVKWYEKNKDTGVMEEKPGKRKIYLLDLNGL